MNSAPRTNHKLMKGSHRSAVIGNDRSARFFLDLKLKDKEFYVDGAREQTAEAEIGDEIHVRAARRTLKPKPERFQNYTQKRPTAEELEEKQRLAAERKQKIDEKKIQQAKKVSEEAIHFDKKVKPQLEKLEKQNESSKKWYSSAIKFS